MTDEKYEKAVSIKENIDYQKRKLYSLDQPISRIIIRFTCSGKAPVDDYALSSDEIEKVKELLMKMNQEKLDKYEAEFRSL
jgi:hypothetical protein